jgi:CheY-like chemotaxis protein
LADPRRVSGTEVRKRAIVADDSVDSREVMTAVLELHGFIVTQARDGQELYERIMSAEVGAFRLVVTEHLLPGLTGTQVLARVGARAQFVIVTASPTPELRAAAERYGVAAVLGKPLDVPAFVEVVLDVAEATPVLLPRRLRASD